MKKESKFQSKYLIAPLSLCIIGILMMVVCLGASDITSFIVGFWSGFIFILVGLAVLLLSIYSMQKRSERAEKAWTQLLRQFDKWQNNRSGIIWVWVVCLATICIWSMAYMVIMWPTMMIIDTITASYAFTGAQLVAINLMIKVLAWMPCIMVIGLIIWAMVNSQKREEVTYPY